MASLEGIQISPKHFHGHKEFCISMKDRNQPPARLIINHALWAKFGVGSLQDAVRGFAEEVLAKDPGPAFGRCLELRREGDEFKVCAGFQPDMHHWLSPLSHFQMTSDQAVIPVSALDIHPSSTKYLTENTALVTYAGQRFIAKSGWTSDSAPVAAQEHRALGALDHPHVIKRPRYVVTLDAHPDRGLAFLLEHHPHGNLREYALEMRAQGRVRLDLFRRWAIQFASALDHVRRHVNYENIKPENAVVDADENLVLIDVVEGERCHPAGIAPEVLDAYYDDLYPDRLYQLLAPPLPRVRCFIPVDFMCEEREKAMVYSLGRALWIVWECTPATPSLGRGHNKFDPMLFTHATDDVPASWKEFLLRFNGVDPDGRPTFKEIVEFFERQSPTVRTDPTTETATATATATTVDLRPKEPDDAAPVDSDVVPSLMCEDTLSIPSETATPPTTTTPPPPTTETVTKENWLATTSTARARARARDRDREDDLERRRVMTLHDPDRAPWMYTPHDHDHFGWR
ncbi:MAG: hypothetical protein M1826_004236 [Phylliscum demangeonii]|nr:MAG: hypothetical protein M1826_004236 [Phylliscum demangeonii]